MSSPIPESQGVPSQDPGSLSVQPPMARYTIHIPVHDSERKEIPHVLGAVRQAMTDAGLEGRTVVRRAQGDWKDNLTHEVDLVMADAPDDPGTLQLIQTIAQGAAQLSGQQAVYVTKSPIQTYLVNASDPTNI